MYLEGILFREKRGVPVITGTPRFFVLCLEKNLSRKRPLKNRLALSPEGRARTPQRIALWITMGMRKPIRMADADVTVAIRRRGLRQPRRITDRAEIDGHGTNVVADGL